LQVYREKKEKNDMGIEMKVDIILGIYLAFMLTACAPSQAQTATATNTPTLNVPSPTATHTDTPTAIPSKTPPPPTQVEFYRIRFEYTTTSDWASLEILNPDIFTTMALIETFGNPKQASVSPSGMNLYRPYTDLANNPQAGLIFDAAIQPDQISIPIEIISKHGAINGSGLNVFVIESNGEAKLIQEIKHYWTDENNPDTSAVKFTLDLSSSSANPSNLTAKSYSRPEKLALAFYYPWFPGYGWSDRTPMSDAPLESISYKNPESFAWQIDQAKSAGIDGFIVSYNSDWADDRVETLLEIAEKKDFKISLYLETLNSGGPAWSPNTLQGWIEHAYRKFADSPAFLTVNAKPVFFIYSSTAIPLNSWNKIFTYLRNREINFLYIGAGYNADNLSTFDGVHDYAIYQYENLADTYNNISRITRHYQLLADGEVTHPKIWAATVSPGFDSTPYKLAIPHAFIIPRANGEYYQSTIAAALQSDPDWILITSWNEYGENTHIEPSKRDGDLFLDITRTFIEQWKNPR
jgi:hypothetical protein